jgi:hypothetical protein
MVQLLCCHVALQSAEKSVLFRGTGLPVPQVTHCRTALAAEVRFFKPIHYRTPSLCKQS